MTEGVIAVTSKEDRGALAKMIMQLFDHWQLTSAESLSMLGLAPDNRASLSRYRSGEPLAASRDLLERVGHLLAIHKNLRLLFPSDRATAYQWIKIRNRAFEMKTPAEAVVEYGFVGLLMVRTYLDRARGN